MHALRILGASAVPYPGHTADPEAITAPTVECGLASSPTCATTNRTQFPWFWDLSCVCEVHWWAWWCVHVCEHTLDYSSSLLFHMAFRAWNSTLCPFSSGAQLGHLYFLITNNSAAMNVLYMSPSITHSTFPLDMSRSRTGSCEHLWLQSKRLTSQMPFLLQWRWLYDFLSFNLLIVDYIN